MNACIDSPVLALASGQVLTLDDAMGMRIQATAGTLWVTEEDDLVDHIIGPGDALVIAKPGRTVVQALAPAWISIRESVVPANDPTQTAA